MTAYFILHGAHAKRFDFVYDSPKTVRSTLKNLDLENGLVNLFPCREKNPFKDTVAGK